MKWVSNLFAVAPGITSGTAKEAGTANTIHWRNNTGKKGWRSHECEKYFQVATA